MSSGKEVNRYAFDTIKRLQGMGVDRDFISDISGYSLTTANRICGAEDWTDWCTKKDAYAKKARQERKREEANDKVVDTVLRCIREDILSRSEVDDEPKAEITFRGDIIDLSRLSGIAAILGIEEVKKL